MSKKRVNFGSVAVSEAARRELMKPVTCWEKTWVVPEGSKVRVRQWVQTNKQPEWSDDEADTIDQPLAPILDVEVVDMDEDEEGADGADPAAPTATAEGEVSTGDTLLPPDASNIPPDVESMAAVSTPQDETEGTDLQAELTLEPTLDMVDPPGFDGNGLTTDTLSGDLDTGDLGDFGAVDLTAGLDTGDLTGADLGPVDLAGVDGFADLTADPLEMLPPDGTAFEAVQDLSQVDEGDQLLGGKVMDESGDPFVSIS